MATKTLIYTVGHGDRTLQELIDLLRPAGVDLVVDVRRYPGSHRHPHFGREHLEQSLPAAGIDYLFEGERLGGRRRDFPGSPHTALLNAGFRAYADHMGTSPFRSAVNKLLSIAARRTPAVMCAERLPWRCHRFFLADSLLLAGAQVIHLVGPGQEREHHLSPYARIEAGRLIYDQTEAIEAVEVELETATVIRDP